MTKTLTVPKCEAMTDPIDPIDPVALTQALVKCASVTPADEGALDVLSNTLEQLGFTCTRLPFSQEGTPDVDNLYARLGTASPNFCFAGHTDVVPPGAASDWSADPFQGEIKDGVLTGRGAVDMKGAIAAFCAAVSQFVKDDGGFVHSASPARGSISLLITGDEEGPSINGTKKMLAWLAENGETIDHCLVGEPTNRSSLGDMMKIGRRASLSAWVTVEGVQGHVAYPDRAKNPVPALMEILSRLTARTLDEGTNRFEPSNLEVTDIDVGNKAVNVIPARAVGRINIRFNDQQSSTDLRDWIEQVAKDVAAEMDRKAHVRFAGQGDAFYFEPGDFAGLVADAVEEETAQRPEYSTGGGTSDARFIKDVCPVAEFGLVGASMHKVDEQVSLKDLEALTRIYHSVLKRYFAPGSP